LPEQRDLGKWPLSGSAIVEDGLIAAPASLGQCPYVGLNIRGKDKKSTEPGTVAHARQRTRKL